MASANCFAVVRAHRVVTVVFFFFFVFVKRKQYFFAALGHIIVRPNCAPLANANINWKSASQYAIIPVFARARDGQCSIYRLLDYTITRLADR